MRSLYIVLRWLIANPRDAWELLKYAATEEHNEVTFAEPEPTPWVPVRVVLPAEWRSSTDPRDVN